MVHSFRDRRRNILIADASQRGVPAWFLVAIASLLLAISTPVGAQVLTWDPNGATDGTGGSGTWDTTSLFWTDTSGTVAWPNNFFTDAFFGGTSGTVTLTTPISVNDIRFASDYVLTGSSITLGPTGPVSMTFDSGVTVELQNPLNLSTGVTWNRLGLGTLILSGTLHPNSTIANANFEGTTILRSGLYGGTGRVNWWIGTNSQPGALLQTGGTLSAPQVGGSDGLVLRIGSPNGQQYGFYGLSGGRLNFQQTYSNGSVSQVNANSAWYVSGTSLITWRSAGGGPMQMGGVLYATGGSATLPGDGYSHQPGLGGGGFGDWWITAGGHQTLTGSSDWTTTSSGTLGRDVFQIAGTLNLNSDGINSGRFTTGQTLATATTGRLNFDGGILRIGPGWGRTTNVVLQAAQA